MHALLLRLSLALAADPGLADLDAAAARARALTISGPAPGQRLTQKQESALLSAQLRDRARAVQEAERIAGALILSGDPQVQVAALLRLGWIQVEFGEAIRESYVPPRLSLDQVDLYRLGLEDRVFGIFDIASTAALQAEALAPPGSPESTELLRLYLALRRDPGRVEDLACAPRPPGPSGRRRDILVELKPQVAHLRSDLETHAGCLPPELTQELSVLDEQLAEALTDGDASMAPDLQVFVSVATEQVHEALAKACGVSDHLPAGEPPEAAPPDPSPAAAPIPDLAGLRAALDLAVAHPQDAPQPSCLRGPTSEAALLRLGALRSVERAAQGLGGSAAHRALADAFTQASRDLGAHLPAAGLVVPSAEVARQAAGARWAAARADQHLWAIATDAQASEAERSQALDDLVSLTRWRLMLEATRPPEPIDARRVER